MFVFVRNTHFQPLPFHEIGPCFAQADIEKMQGANESNALKINIIVIVAFLFSLWNNLERSELENLNDKCRVCFRNQAKRCYKCSVPLLVVHTLKFHTARTTTGIGKFHQPTHGA